MTTGAVSLQTGNSPSRRLQVEVVAMRADSTSLRLSSSQQMYSRFIESMSKECPGLACMWQSKVLDFSLLEM